MGERALATQPTNIFIGAAQGGTNPQQLELSRANRHGLDLVARALLEHETIDGAEVTRLINLAGGTGTGTDGFPARSTLFYTMHLFATACYDLRMGYASAMAYVLFVLSATLTWLATRASRERMSHVQ